MPEAKDSEAAIKVAPPPNRSKTEELNATLSPCHQRLLQASFLSGDRAITAWNQWQTQINFEALDWHSYCLLPLLYQNLVQHDIQHPWMGRMKGIQRLFWCKNQVMLSTLGQISQFLQTDGVEIAVLGEVALILTGDRLSCDRLLTRLDLQVQPRHIPLMLERLSQLGWHSTAIDWVRSFCWIPALWLNREQHPPVVLHHRFSPQRSKLTNWTSPDLIDRVWQRTKNHTGYPGQTVQAIQSAQTKPVRVWDVTDQLLHLCVQHGLARSRPAPVWLADLLWLLQNPAIDWHYLQDTARTYRVLLPLQTMLTLLKRLDLPVPAAAEAIAQAPLRKFG